MTGATPACPGWAKRAPKCSGERSHPLEERAVALVYQPKGHSSTFRLLILAIADANRDVVGWRSIPDL
jgi:hypothetical protein